MIVGVDEVGRGPFAGPVVAAAVALPAKIDGLADSKALSARKREHLCQELSARAIYAFGAASVDEIDRINILAASMLAMQRAVSRLSIEPELVLVDGNRAPELDCKVKTVVGGDRIVPEISAASIMAKVLRDALMIKLDRRYPGYGWARNAGYGTHEHQTGMADLGITPHHRRSFRPVALLCQNSTRRASPAKTHHGQ